MSAATLDSLHERTIAIDLVLGDRRVQLHGTGHYERLSPAGPVLRIHIADPAGDFDILLEEGRFVSAIGEDELSGQLKIDLEVADLSAAF